MSVTFTGCDKDTSLLRNPYITIPDYFIAQTAWKFYRIPENALEVCGTSLDSESFTINDVKKE